MKRLVIYALVLISLGAYARNVSTAGNMKSEESMKNAMVAAAVTTDGFMLKDGKMVTVTNGKLTAMESDVTLPNGTVVMSTGYFMKKDGLKTELKEGELIDMNGKLVKADDAADPKTSTDKNVNDSTKSKW